MCSPTIRAVRSSVPPAANGTIIVIGREGKVCALAVRETARTAAAPAARCRKFRRGSFIFELPSAFTSFDYLIGAGEQRRRHFEIEHPCGLSVNDKLELAHLLDRQFPRLRTLENATGIDADNTPRIRDVGSVVHQPAGFGDFHAWRMSWEPRGAPPWWP